MSMIGGGITSAVNTEDSSIVETDITLVKTTEFRMVFPSCYDKVYYIHAPKLPCCCQFCFKKTCSFSATIALELRFLFQKD